MKFIKKTLLKGVSIIATGILVLSLCSCISFTDFTSDSFLSPPKPNGDMYDIQQTLEESVDSKFTLKYPTAGEYRSAYITADLMSAGKEEFALAFYSVLGEENVVSMHLNLMKKVDEDWLSISDVSVAATGVEKVLINDLNGDGICEIIVGWNIYSNVDKRVAVYAIKGLSLVTVMQESYTNIICCDLENSGNRSLFVLSHNQSEGTAVAKIYGFNGDTLSDGGSCLIDGNVTSFYEPIVTEISNGANAIFIDAVKGTGTQTEILYSNNGILTRADLIIDESGTLATYRNSSVLCNDINGDGKYNIPVSGTGVYFTTTEDNLTLATAVKWSSFDGTGLTQSIIAAMNYTDGYYLEIPNRWIGKITVETDVESRLYTVSVWDTEQNVKMGELFKLRTVTDVEWDKENNGLETYKEVKRNENLVYIAAVGNYSGIEQTSMDEIISLTNIIV